VKTEHVAYVCDSQGCCDWGRSCMFCDGGLFCCTVCNSFEGATTTECPGRRLTQAETEAVYAGSLDYRGGAWVQAPSGSCSSHYDGRPGLPPEALP
jgi:hypothetical protein